MGTPPSFSAMFSNKDSFRDFLFAYLEDEDFPKWGLLFMERICSDIGGNNENDIPIFFGYKTEFFPSKTIQKF